MQKRIYSVFLLLLFALFLYKKSIVINGAASGLQLWYQTILPTLLPILFLTKLMLRYDTISILSKILHRPAKIFPGISSQGAFAALIGYVSGFPVGAKTTADLINTGKINKKEGEYLLSFCNNASPMFILGYVIKNYVIDASMHRSLFLILFFTPLVCSQIFRVYYTFFYREKLLSSTFKNKSHTVIERTSDAFENTFLASSFSGSDVIEISKRSKVKQPSFEDCIFQSVETIVMIGFYIMLFSIFIQFILSVSWRYKTIPYLLASQLEITNGIHLISTLHVSEFYKNLFYAFSVSFGGICSLFQTYAMVRESSLSIKNYIIEKLITATVTSFFVLCYLLS